MPEPSDIGSTIRKYRIKNGFSQKELGEKCGLTQQAINRIEHGKRNIESELLIKFVKILNIDFCDILEEMKGLESDEFTCIDTALHPEKWGW